MNYQENRIYPTDCCLTPGWHRLQCSDYQSLDGKSNIVCEAYLNPKRRFLLLISFFKNKKSLKTVKIYIIQISFKF